MRPAHALDSFAALHFPKLFQANNRPNCASVVVILGGLPVSEYASWLDGYLETLLEADTGVRNGILTDGVHYFLRRVGEEKLPVLPHGAMQTCNHSEQASRLREYLHGIITAQAENISPTSENLEMHSESNSDAFHAGNLILQEAYETYHNDPTVVMKRWLCQYLL